MYRGKVLSIAGSDPGGGAGIQADLKTITMLGCYAACCITSLTAQNTTGVYGVWDVAPDVLERQICCVLNDIKIDAIKIGMLPSNLAETVYRILPGCVPIVFDPVMVSTSGHALVEKKSFSTLMGGLAGKTLLITPNLEEAEMLSGKHITSREDILQVGKELAKSFKTHVLIKGCSSDQEDYIENILFSESDTCSFRNRKIDKTFHGTGCTLSSAIACFIAQGLSLEKSIKAAMHYVSQTLNAGIKVGAGFDPVFHNYGVIATKLHKPEEHLQGTSQHLIKT